MGTYNDNQKNRASKEAWTGTSSVVLCRRNVIAFPAEVREGRGGGAGGRGSFCLNCGRGTRRSGWAWGARTHEKHVVCETDGEAAVGVRRQSANAYPTSLSLTLPTNPFAPGVRLNKIDDRYPPPLPPWPFHQPPSAARRCKKSDAAVSSSRGPAPPSRLCHFAAIRLLLAAVHLPPSFWPHPPARPHHHPRPAP